MIASTLFLISWPTTTNFYSNLPSYIVISKIKVLHSLTILLFAPFSDLRAFGLSPYSSSFLPNLSIFYLCQLFLPPCLVLDPKLPLSWQNNLVLLATLGPIWCA